jgi:hypothetical protein
MGRKHKKQMLLKRRIEERNRLKWLCVDLGRA